MSWKSLLQLARIIYVERYNLFENKLTYCDIYILISDSIKVIYIKLLYIKILVIRYLKKKNLCTSLSIFKNNVNFNNDAIEEWT